MSFQAEDQLFDIALQHHQAGNLSQAAEGYRQILARNPDQPEALNLLGTVYHQTGNNDLATEFIGRAIAIDPDNPFFLDNLGTVYQVLGRLDDAETCYRKVIGLDPSFAGAHFNLGCVLLKQEQPDNAVTSFQNALALKPEYVDAYICLGNTFKVLGKMEQSLTCYLKALSFNPNYAEVHFNLGITLQELGKIEKAIHSYRRSLSLKPNFAEAHFNLGNALKTLCKIEEAIECYKDALSIRPDYVEAQLNLGIMFLNNGEPADAITIFRKALSLRPNNEFTHNFSGIAFQELGALEAAIDSYHTAIALRPDFAEAHCNLGNALREQGKLPEAVKCFQIALAIKPDYADAHCNLGIVLQEECKPDGAISCYLTAYQLGVLGARIKSAFMLPAIMDTPRGILENRLNFEKNLDELIADKVTLDDPLRSVGQTNFYLTYHGLNNRNLQAKVAKFYAQACPSLLYTAPHCLEPKSEIPKKIRIGFLSEFLVEHTIGHLYQGIIAHLDRNRFEVLVIHSPKAKQDAFRKQVDTLADKALTLPLRLVDQHQAVAAEQLDVLFYPDVGMSLFTYFLAYARLAPVQAVSWGHPDTTGLDSMDYFISATIFETEDGDEHYTERLIRMNRMPCFYLPPKIQYKPLPRSEFGLPETGTLYGCPQSLFKFHPDFDAVLAAIAEGDPDGRIVLLEGKNPIWTDLLKSRWKNSFPVLLDRVLFLPAMSRNRFISLQALMDVLLDPIHFGGGNTFYEAMIYGTPMVSWPGKFMCSRIVSGGYLQMGLSDAPIARNLEDYAPLALALGRDPERRLLLRQSSRESANRELFSDISAVREFEFFLEAAVSAAHAGGKLPAGWKPAIPF